MATVCVMYEVQDETEETVEYLGYSFWSKSSRLKKQSYIMQIIPCLTKKWSQFDEVNYHLVWTEDNKGADIVKILRKRNKLKIVLKLLLQTERSFRLC